MQTLIRELDHQKTQTHVTKNINECRSVLNANNKNINFTLIHQNIRSISKNIDEFLITLKELGNDFDLIILTETWRIQNASLYSISDYETIYSNGNYNQNDGILVYIKKSILKSFEIIQLTNNVIKINAEIHGKSIVVTTIYRPPSTKIQNFNNSLKQYLANLENHDYSFMVGDINIDINGNTEETNEYLNIMTENGYVSLINDNTRMVNNSKSCIDHIFLKTKKKKSDTKPIIYETNITDHFIIMNSLILGPTKTTSRPTTGQNRINKINIPKLRSILNAQLLNDTVEHNNVQEGTNKFISYLKLKIQEVTRTIKITSRNKKRNEWITEALLTSVSKKQKLYQRLKQHPNNLNLREEYNTYKNTLTSLIRTAKRKYFQEKIKSGQSNNKVVWNTINSLIGKTKQTIPVKQVITEDNINSIDPKEIADTFVKHYSNVGQNLADKISLNPQRTIKYRVKRCITDSFFLTPTCQNEIQKIIKDLPAKSSTGIDGINTKILKGIADIIANPLAALINKIIETGTCPHILKTSIITPIYKKGDKNQPVSYRPISVIPTLAKILEKVVNKRLTAFLEKNKIISQEQYGFRKNISTSNAITDLVTNLQQALDESKTPLCIFIDLEKAFDTVNHSILLDTLESYGIRGTPLQFFNSYLSNRTQYVKINDTLSIEKTLNCGVPQGTVLGPTLFLVYINDLYNIETKGKIISYADDTVIIYKHQSWETVKRQAEKDLINIKQWFDNKLLTINFDKTFFMAFSCYNDTQPKFDYLEIEATNRVIKINKNTSSKYLGIHIDCNLKWKVHIDALVNRMRTILYTMRMLKSVLNQNELKTVYHSLAESLLQYGIIGWGSASQSHLKPLDTVQRSLIKTIFNKNWQYPTNSLYEETRILHSKQLFARSILMYQFKTNNQFETVNHCYDTKSKTNKNYVIHRAQKKIGQKSIIYLGTKLYNELDTTTKSINQYRIFKTEITKWIKTKGHNYFINRL